MKDHNPTPPSAREDEACGQPQGFPCAEGTRERAFCREPDASTCRPERESVDRSRIENRLRASNTLLELLGSTDSRKEYLGAVIGHLIEWTGCSCAGIRILDKKGGIPYEATSGFDDEFKRSETDLQLGRDNCICTRVAEGEPISHEWCQITSSGSFSCGDTGEFVSKLTEDELSSYRGVCIARGFTSMTIIPIRRKNELVGMIHLADKRADAFPKDIVELVESLTPLMGEAITGSPSRTGSGSTTTPRTRSIRS